MIKLPTAPADQTKPISVVKTQWRIRVFVKENCVTRHRKGKVLVFIILGKIESVQNHSIISAISFQSSLLSHNIWFIQLFYLFGNIFISLWGDTFFPPSPLRKWKNVLPWRTWIWVWGEHLPNSTLENKKKCTPHGVWVRGGICTHSHPPWDKKNECVPESYRLVRLFKGTSVTLTTTVWWGIPKGYVPLSLSWHFFNFISSLNGKMPGKPDWCSKDCTLDREIPDLLWICYMLHFNLVSNIIMQLSSFYFTCFLLSNPALTSNPTCNSTPGTESHTQNQHLPSYLHLLLYRCLKIPQQLYQ